MFSSYALVLSLLSLAAPGADNGFGTPGLRIRNTAAVRLVVEARVTTASGACDSGTPFRTYRIEPRRIWVIPPAIGERVCWRWREDVTAGVWSAWEKVNPADDEVRNLAVAR